MMGIVSLKAQSTGHLFNVALQRGFRNRLKHRLLHQPTNLLNYEEWKVSHHLKSQQDQGIDVICVDNIVGSIGHFNDFDIDFMPCTERIGLKWQHILELMLDGTSLPPINVYETYAGYFVIDGNHRVSVSQFLGVQFVDAHIIYCDFVTVLDENNQSI